MAGFDAARLWSRISWRSWRGGRRTSCRSSPSAKPSSSATGRDIPWHEEVASWRDLVYWPMIETLRRSGILEELPGWLGERKELNVGNAHITSPSDPDIWNFEGPADKLGVRSCWCRHDRL